MFALASAALVLMTTAIAVATVQKSPDTARPGEGIEVTLRGCVSGSLLKSVRGDPSLGAGAVVPGDRYRMIGSKDIKAQIKKANKAAVEVTGRVKPGPQSVVKGTKMGGTSVGIGVAPGPGSMDDPQAPYTPTIEVDAIVVLMKTCE